jgi:hypothetical protein
MPVWVADRKKLLLLLEMAHSTLKNFAGSRENIAESVFLFHLPTSKRDADRWWAEIEVA